MKLILTCLAASTLLLGVSCDTPVAPPPGEAWTLGECFDGGPVAVLFGASDIACVSQAGFRSAPLDTLGYASGGLYFDADERRVRAVLNTPELKGHAVEIDLMDGGVRRLSAFEAVDSQLLGDGDGRLLVQSLSAGPTGMPPRLSVESSGVAAPAAFEVALPVASEVRFLAGAFSAGEGASAHAVISAEGEIGLVRIDHAAQSSVFEAVGYTQAPGLVAYDGDGVLWVADRVTGTVYQHDAPDVFFESGRPFDERTLKPLYRDADGRVVTIGPEEEGRTLVRVPDGEVVFAFDETVRAVYVSPAGPGEESLVCGRRFVSDRFGGIQYPDRVEFVEAGGTERSAADVDLFLIEYDLPAFGCL